MTILRSLFIRFGVAWCGLVWRGVALLAIPMHMASPFNPSSLHRIADVLRMGTCTHFRVQHFHSPVRFFSALSRPLYFAFILMLTSMRSSHVIGRILRCNAVPCTIWWQKTTQQQQQRQYEDKKKKTQTNCVKKYMCSKENKRRNNGDVIVDVVADVAVDRKPSFLIK